jgi:hypothetical protein
MYRLPFSTSLLISPFRDLILSFMRAANVAFMLPRKCEREMLISNYETQKEERERGREREGEHRKHMFSVTLVS